jgi:DnaJ-class molecular chaperone
VLGLAHDFSADELKKAYRAATLAFHPDKRTGSADAFARVKARPWAHGLREGQR